MRLLVLFVSIDAAFIALHMVAAAVRHAGLIESEVAGWLQLFSIVNDHGLPETFNQLKALLAAAVLYTTWTRTRQPVYLCWTFIFAVAFLDDALRIHEQAGEGLAGILLAGVAAEHREFIGQLLVAGVYAILFGAMLLFAHACAERRHARSSSLVLFVFAIVVFFAVVVDALHGVLLAVRPELRASMVFQALFNVLEEGGELLSLSLALAVVIAIRAATEAPAPSADTGACRGSVQGP
ncbi:MAG: hypothetical protein U0S49_12055 [Rhodospirillales bacterium]|nr:hypothetical protein [Rhodospirillales bacterium]